MSALHPLAELSRLRRICLDLWVMDAYIIRKRIFIDYMEARERTSRVVVIVHDLLMFVPRPGWTTDDRRTWQDVITWAWENLTDQGKDAPTIRTVELPEEGTTT